MEQEDIPPQDPQVDNHEEEEDSRKKRATFLGTDPAETQKQELVIDQSVAERIINWISVGLPKEEKEASLSLIPLTGSVNLESPLLNPEVSANLKPKALLKDGYFKNYQTLAGASVAAAAQAFEQVLDQVENSEEKDTLLSSIAHVIKLSSDLFYQLNVARKSFLIGPYDEKMQKLLRESKSTSLLFGDDLKGRLESAKAMEKISKDLLAKPRMAFKSKENLNSKYPPSTRDRRGGSPRKSRQPARVHRLPSYKEQPAKSYYAQTQPQKGRR